MKRLTQILLFLFILFLPTQLGKHFFLNFSYVNGVRVDYLAPTIYLTDLIILLLIAINFKTIISIFKNKSLVLILFLLLVNVLFSLSKPIAIYRFIKIIEIIALITIIKKNKLKEKPLLIAFIISTSMELLLVIFQLINKHSIQGIFYLLGERYLNLSMPGIAKATLNGVELLRPYATFSHPNSLAGFYLLVYGFFLTNKKFQRFLIPKSIILLITSLLIFFSFSKIAIITYLILNTLYLILNTKNRCRLCFVAKIAVPLILTIIFLQAQTDPLTINKRIDLIKNSLVLISQRPLFGVGLGNYVLAQASFSSKYYNFLNQPVHNIFLLLLTELGVIIPLIIIFISRNYLRKVFKAKYLYLILIILITGSFDHYWLTLQQNILLLGTIVAI